MTFFCMDKCVESPRIFGVYRYMNGERYCKTCGIWQKSSELRCGCCNGRFRTKPRNIENRYGPKCFKCGKTINVNKEEVTLHLDGLGVNKISHKVCSNI